MAKGKKKRGRKVTKHHVVPSSRRRGGDRDHNNIVNLDKEWHIGYHRLFENMTVREVHKYIDKVMTPGTTWTRRQLIWLREEIMDESLNYSIGGNDDDEDTEA